MKRYYSIEEIEKMSDEEVSALNRRALRNMAIFMAAKWGLLFIISRAAKKYYENHANPIIQKEQ